MAHPTPFELTVSGLAVIPLLAERAIINVVVSSDGKEKSTVTKEVIAAAKQIEKLLHQVAPQDDSPEAKAAAPLAHWSKTSLSATSYVPGSTDHDHHPARRYKSTVRFDIRFREFKALGAFGVTISSISHVEVSNTEWILTTETKDSYRFELRKTAARNAMRKAQDYRDVLGCGNLRPIELDDTNGNDSYQARGSGRTMQTARRSAAPAQMYTQSMQSMPGYNEESSEDASGLEFTPQEVQMSMEEALTVKFHADALQHSS
ncbi:hypothetical protein TI39_contig407g00010 [Zymoseptoria brevis]|uniref:Uncharacterized protein n=1 Tax=Zymoseptoria brevis TaxID=1047168 RepID=A0A0F4GQR9_9PEZI|nr:hypothetical protein TI39_contig407g00010 [Zymoseptoria brevis]